MTVGLTQSELDASSNSTTALDLLLHDIEAGKKPPDLQIPQSYRESMVSLSHRSLIPGPVIPRRPVGTQGTTKRSKGTPFSLSVTTGPPSSFPRINRSAACIPQSGSKVLEDSDASRIPDFDHHHGLGSGEARVGQDSVTSDQRSATPFQCIDNHLIEEQSPDIETHDSSHTTALSEPPSPLIFRLSQTSGITLMTRSPSSHSAYHTQDNDIVVSGSSYESSTIRRSNSGEISEDSEYELRSDFASPAAGQSIKSQVSLHPVRRHSQS